MEGRGALGVGRGARVGFVCARVVSADAPGPDAPFFPMPSQFRLSIGSVFKVNAAEWTKALLIAPSLSTVPPYTAARSRERLRKTSSGLHFFLLPLFILCNLIKPGCRYFYL